MQRGGRARGTRSVATATRATSRSRRRPPPTAEVPLTGPEPLTRSLPSTGPELSSPSGRISTVTSTSAAFVSACGQITQRSPRTTAALKAGSAPSSPAHVHLSATGPSEVALALSRSGASGSCASWHSSESRRSPQIRSM
eukprot:916054-Pyramimonas_sp.AAC.1